MQRETIMGTGKGEGDRREKKKRQIDTRLAGRKDRSLCVPLWLRGCVLMRANRKGYTVMVGGDEVGCVLMTFGLEVLSSALWGVKARILKPGR